MPGLPHHPETIPALAREQFPALTANPEVAYLDSAATTQKPRQVINAVAAALAVQTANPGRGGYPWSSRGARRIAEIRERTARFIGASGPEEIVFTPGATAGLNAVALSWGLANLADGDEILYSPNDHSSNVYPLVQHAYLADQTPYRTPAQFARGLRDSAIFAVISSTWYWELQASTFRRGMIPVSFGPGPDGTVRYTAETVAMLRAMKEATIAQAHAATPMTTGTNTAEIRSASRCAGALPACAWATSRAIWASWVPAPTRFARTTSRPCAFTHPPVTLSADLGRDRLPGQHRRINGRAARDHDPVGGDLLPGPDNELFARGKLLHGDPHLGAVPQHRGVPGPQRQQRAQRRAGPAPGAGLEVATEQDQRGHAGRDLEVGGVSGADVRQPGEAHPRPRLACRAEEQRVQRPQVRGGHSERDQRVHGGRTVPGIDDRGAVERPGAPYRDRGGQRERGPLPVPELQPRDHRQHHHRDRQRQRDQQALPQRVRLGGALVLCRRAARVILAPGGQGHGVTSLLDHRDQLPRGHRGREGHRGGGGSEVDRGGDAVQSVQLLLHPGRARRARHPADRELSAADRACRRVASDCVHPRIPLRCAATCTTVRSEEIDL